MTTNITLVQKGPGAVLQLLKPPSSRSNSGHYLKHASIRRSIRASSPSPARSRYAPSQWDDALATEVYDCAAWADQRTVFVSNFHGRQLFRVTPALIYKSIGVAAAAVATLRSTTPVTSIEALFTPESFSRIVQRCTDFVVIRALLQLARDWLQLRNSQIAGLEVIARAATYF